MDDSRKEGGAKAGREARGGEKKRSAKRECAQRGSRTKWQRSERTDQFDVQSETWVPVGAREPGPGRLQFSRGLLAEIVGCAKNGFGSKFGLSGSGGERRRSCDSSAARTMIIMMQLSDNVIPVGVCFFSFFFLLPCSVSFSLLENRRTHFGNAIQIILWMAVKIGLSDFGTETLLVGVGDDPNRVNICKFQKNIVMAGERYGGERGERGDETK